MTRRVVRLYRTVRLRFRVNRWRFVFLPATWGSGYRPVDIQWQRGSRFGEWKRGSLHPKERKHDLRRSGVELDRYERFRPHRYLGAYAPLRCGINAVRECFVSRDDTMCDVVWNGRTAVLRKCAVFCFPPRLFWQWVFKRSFPIFVISRVAGEFTPSGGAR